MSFLSVLSLRAAPGYTTNTLVYSVSLQSNQPKNYIGAITLFTDTGEIAYNSPSAGTNCPIPGPVHIENLGGGFVYATAAAQAGSQTWLYILSDLPAQEQPSSAKGKSALPPSIVSLLGKFPKGTRFIQAKPVPKGVVFARPPAKVRKGVRKAVNIPMPPLPPGMPVK